MTDLIERTLTAEAGVDRMIEKAKQKWSDFMKKEVKPVVSDTQLKEIEKWKQSAMKILMK